MAHVVEVIIFYSKLVLKNKQVPWRMMFKYLQYNIITSKKKCGNDHGHCNVTQTTTI